MESQSRKKPESARRRRIATAAVFLAVSVCWSTRAEEKSPLQIEELVRMKSFHGAPVFSLDGKWLAYVIKSRPATHAVSREEHLRTGVGGRELGCDIFVLSMATREAKNLTEGIGANWAPVWSPDNRYLAFLSDRDGSEQSKLWIWDSRDNKLRKASEAAIRAGALQHIEWSRDSQKIFTGVVPEGMTGTSYADSISSGQDVTESSAKHDATVLVYESGTSATVSGRRASGPTLSIADDLRDIAEIDIQSGKITRLVRNQRIAFFHLTPDGSHLVYSVPQKLEADGSQQILFDLAVLEMSRGRQTVVVSDVRLELFGRFSVSPDSSWIAYIANDAGGHSCEVFLTSVTGGKSRSITHCSGSRDNSGSEMPQRISLPTPLWAIDGKTVFFISKDALWRASVDAGTAIRAGSIEGHTVKQVFSLPDDVLWSPDSGRSVALVARNDATKEDSFQTIDLTTGRNRKMLERGECYSCEGAIDSRFVATSREPGSVAYLAESAERAADLWLLDWHSGDPQQLTQVNPELAKSKMGAAELISWLDDDGREQHGALLRPADYIPGAKYPLLVLVYGGVRMSGDLYRFEGHERGMPFFHPQLFASRGYAVLMPDAPQNLGTPMQDLAKTVLPGINTVIERGIADPQRLGVMGHSYGGYSTLCLLVQTNRFKAAVDAAGMAEMIGLYGEMERDGTAFGTSAETTMQLGGDPWQVRDRYIENSPIFFLDRIETPLMILEGAEDREVASFLTDEIFVDMRRLGKTVSYVKYLGEPHVPGGYSHQIDIGTRILDWFDLYLKAAAGKGARPTSSFQAP